MFDQMANYGNGGQGGPWPFPEKECLRIILGVADACQALISHGWAHRDIKPHNILLSDERPSRPILMDLGSVAVHTVTVTNRSEAMKLQDDCASKCTAPYRAPELMDVKTQCQVDERTDVWSLGCTLFAMAFGHGPFENEVEGVLSLAILSGTFEFPPGNSHAGETFSDGFCKLIRLIPKSHFVACSLSLCDYIFISIPFAFLSVF